MTKDMFSSFTKAVVKKMYQQLVTNDDMKKKWELQTLVKFRTKKQFLFLDAQRKYTLLPLKMDQIIDEKQGIESKMETLVENCQNISFADGSIEAGGGGQEAAGHQDSVDTSEVTLMKDCFRWEEVEDLMAPIGPKQLKVKHNTADLIKLKPGEKLTYVKERVYNSRSVHVLSRTSPSRSTGAKILRFYTAGVKGENTEMTTFSVPEQTVVAVLLEEININDNVLRIAMIPCIRMQNLHFSDIQPVMKRIKNGYENYKDKVLKPLSELPESGRSDLLKKLVEISEDREALLLLEDTLDGVDELPQSELVASFVDLLGGSKDLTEAAELLVSALNVLPDNSPALLGKCDLETLKCLRKKMDHLEKAQEFKYQLRQTSAESTAESPPILQEKEVVAETGGGLAAELSWLENLLSSATNLIDLRSNWDCPDLSPEGLLEVLYVSVGGLIMLQP